MCKLSFIQSNMWKRPCRAYRLCFCYFLVVDRSDVFVRERRPTWAEERRMNAETFGIPLRHHRGRGGYRGRGYGGPRTGRGRSSSRGYFAPRGAPPGFRGTYRVGRGGRDFPDLDYRVNLTALSISLHFVFKQSSSRLKRFFNSFKCIYRKSLKENGPSE